MPRRPLPKMVEQPPRTVESEGSAVSQSVVTVDFTETIEPENGGLYRVTSLRPMIPLDIPIDSRQNRRLFKSNNTCIAPMSDELLRLSKCGAVRYEAVK